jgi:hypothetical protein
MYEPFEEYGRRQPGETYEAYLGRFRKFSDALPPFDWPASSSSSSPAALPTPDTSDTEDYGLQNGQQGDASQTIGK